MRKLRITVEGKVYDVEVEILDEPAAQSVRRPAQTLAPPPVHSPPPSSPSTAAAPSSASAGPGDVPSPLAGRVVSIDCELGAEVAEGDKVVTIEAMKMNTFVNAPASGKVSAIHVAPGDGVEEGQALLTIS